MQDMRELTNNLTELPERNVQRDREGSSAGAPQIRRQPTQRTRIAREREGQCEA